MSIELPEAQILAEQMNKELHAKRIQSFQLQDCESLQRLGFINRDARSFNGLINGMIESVTSRGNVIFMRLDSGMNLILAPEYGGRILYHRSERTIPSKLHLRLSFSDGTALTVRLTGMGVIQALKDDELERSYVYKRDFSEVPSPADEKEFTFERFCAELADRNMMLKSVLVGKDAVVVGFGNSAFQDILFRARIHPKRKASELNGNERRALYDAMKHVLRERILRGGKEGFLDLYGNQGGYAPVMGPNMSRQACPSCGTRIEKLSVGGGQTHFCPKCQR